MRLFLLSLQTQDCSLVQFIRILLNTLIMYHQVSIDNHIKELNNC